MTNEMYSVYDVQCDEYYMENATLSDLQEDVYLTMQDRSEAHDDDLGKEYAEFIRKNKPSDISLSFILSFYRDYEYKVEKII